MDSGQTELLLLLRLWTLHPDPSHHPHPLTFLAKVAKCHMKILMMSPISLAGPVSSIHFALLVLALSSISVVWSLMEGTRIGIRGYDEALVSFHHPLLPLHTLVSLQTSAGSLHVLSYLPMGAQLS